VSAIESGGPAGCSIHFAAAGVYARYEGMSRTAKPSMAFIGVNTLVRKLADINSCKGYRRGKAGEVVHFEPSLIHPFGPG